MARICSWANMEPRHLLPVLAAGRRLERGAKGEPLARRTAAITPTSPRQIKPTGGPRNLTTRPPFSAGRRKGYGALWLPERSHRQNSSIPSFTDAQAGQEGLAALGQAGEQFSGPHAI